MTSENLHPDLPDADAHDERLGALLNEFFDRRERGEPLTKEQFLAEHPAEADDLREHLSGLDLLKGVGSSVGSGAFRGDETIDAKGSSATLSAGEAHVYPRIEGYEIHKLIGRGGMGLVYKATQASTKRQVALKVLLEGPLASEQARKRFEREIEVAAQLRHTNIIPIYDSGKSDGRMYYAMAYVRGQSLSDYLAARRPPLEAKLRMFAKICQAVRHAHQRGVMHRDLKPSNILVDGDNEPHILDFGLAKASSVMDMTMSISAQIVGTPAYMSPEQAAGDPTAIDMRTDIYSLGVVLYEMLTGRMPYDTTSGIARILDQIANAEPKPPHEFDRKISGELSAIVMKALEKNKEQRYQSLDVFQSDIEKYLKGEPISVKPATTLYLIRKTLWRHRIPVGSAAFLLLLGTGVMFVIGHYSRELKHKVEQANLQEQELVAKRQEQERAEEDLERKRAEVQRLEERLRDYNAFIKTIDPNLAEVASSIASGIANPLELPGLVAQGARQLTPAETEAQSKLAAIDPTPSLILGVDEPQISRNPELSKKPESNLIDFNKLSQAVQRFNEERMARSSRATSQPATSQPADEPDEPATTQPLSSAVFQVEAPPAALPNDMRSGPFLRCIAWCRGFCAR